MAHRNRWSRWSKGWFTYSKLLIFQFSKIRALQTLRSRTLDPQAPRDPNPQRRTHQPRPVSFAHPIPWQHALPAWSLRPPAAPNGSGWLMDGSWTIHGKKLMVLVWGYGLDIKKLVHVNLRSLENTCKYANAPQSCKWSSWFILQIQLRLKQSQK